MTLSLLHWEREFSLRQEIRTLLCHRDLGNALRGAFPGRAGGYPPGPPTDPDVRNACIRFLRQSGCYPLAVPWRAVVRVGELKVSPLSPASGGSAWRSPSLPWVAWASLPHLPRYYAPLRLPPCPSRGASLVARLPDTLPAPIVVRLRRKDGQLYHAMISPPSPQEL